jgi:hypothetical protein
MESTRSFVQFEDVRSWVVFPWVGVGSDLRVEWEHRVVMDVDGLRVASWRIGE